MTSQAPRALVLYVAGWGRSGSTLLDRLLGQHPDVVAVGELRDIWLRGLVEDRRCGCGQPFSACPFWIEVGFVAFGGWDHVDRVRLNQLRNTVDRPWTVPLLARPSRAPRAFRRDLDEYAATLRRLYEAISRVAGRPVTVDSSKIATHAMVLHHAGLDLRVVHLVRDSRAVVHSWRKIVDRPDATGQADTMLRYGTATGAGRYVLYNTFAHLLPRLGVPSLRLRYEDLARDPGPSVRAVLGHVGLGPADLGTAPDRPVRLLATHTVDGNPMRFRTGDVPVSLDDQWKRRLPVRHRLVATVLTAPLLRSYGYPLRAGGARALPAAGPNSARPEAQ